MKMTSCIRAYRTLRHLRQYQHLQSIGDAPQYMAEVTLRKDEQICGTYENVPGTKFHAILITTQRLYLENDNKWHSVDYDQIQRIQPPSAEDKHTAQEILIHTTSGEIVILPITGGNGKFRDVWQFVRFFNHAVKDTSS